MKIAVTGASGFIGAALCPALSTAGHDVRKINLRAHDGLAAGLAALSGKDAVIHLAAIAHRGASIDEFRRTNVELARQVGVAAAATGARMVFLSSLKVHGEESSAPLHEASPVAPRGAYARSKAEAENALRQIAGLQLTIVRPPLVYGPGVGANFRALMDAVARGWPLPLANVANRRSLLYVGNLADAILRCAGHDAAEGRTYLVCDGASLSSAMLCRELGEVLHRRARLFPFPPALLGMLPALRTLVESLEADGSAIRRELGWAPPFSLTEALRATAHWYRAR